ncbi:thioredoxin-like protein [Gaertneriomyces semiglobifer]|nr:thioredoxin-like protein [Gaertneriomyces semiglobifer]
MSRKVNIDIVSDTICPWCFVGYRRLQRAIEAFQAKQPSTKLDFAITFKPFELDSTLPKQGINKLESYESKFGKERMAQILPHMQKVGEKEGIAFSYGGLIANTVDSHRLLEYAHTKNVQLPLVEQLFRDYFERNKNIGDINVLADAAQRVGLNREEVIEYLESPFGIQEVKDQIEQAYRRRITGVPHFRIDGRYELGGAQDPEAFVEIFEAIAKQ